MSRSSSPLRPLLALGLLLAAGCGREEPQLFAVVRTTQDAPGACLPLREPSLSSIGQQELSSLRLPEDDYAWLVGETFVGPSGFSSAVSSLTGHSALVSLTSASGGRSASRAVATVEKGKVTHTYFGTPLTPAFPNEDGATLSLTFDARQLDSSALGAAKAVLGAVPLESAAYLKLLASLAPDDGADDGKDKGLSQTYVLRDPRSCASGACQAVIADERLVVLSPGSGKSASDLARTLCLKDGRLYDLEGDEHSGTYAVLRVAHARLPEEALGDTLADTLASLSRCDGTFAPEQAARAADQLEKADALRPADRAILRQLLEDTAFAAKAQTPEGRLEAEQRLQKVSERVCRQTPAQGITCARARSIAACAQARALSASDARDAYRAAAQAADDAERTASPGATCESRAQSLVALAQRLSALAVATRAAHLSGASCDATATGLTCDAFPELSRRAKAAIADNQDLLYRQCFCAPLAQDRDPSLPSRLVREALRCEAAPEELVVVPAPDQPLKDDEVQGYRQRRQSLVPPLSAAQCPACVRLSRRIDDELGRGVLLGRNQAALTGLLRQALAPVALLHDRAFVLMSGETGVRCSARPDEWAVIVQALNYGVEPRDLFKEGGALDPSRLEAKLRQAELLRASLDGLPCTRTPPEQPIATGLPPLPEPPPVPMPRDGVVPATAPPVPPAKTPPAQAKP